MDARRHQQRQQRLKEKVDARIDAATERREIVIVFTGNGKGKTTEGFGTVTRAVGHGLRAGVVQFIKGQWPNGERRLLEPHGVEFQVMATEFTWETQSRELDGAAVRDTWHHARRMLADDTLDVVLLDELTYMISYDYRTARRSSPPLTRVPRGKASSSPGAAATDSCWTWRIPSTRCGRLNTLSMPASWRSRALIGDTVT